MPDLDTYLRPGDGVLDIGGSVGAYARRYARRVGETGSVLSVEPNPAAVATHRRESATLPWLTVLEAAVTDGRTPGLRTLYRDAESHARGSLWAANVTVPGGSLETPTVTLDAIAAQVPRLRGIKIDAQGAEGEILAGGCATLARHDVVWYVELWPVGLAQAGSSVAAVVAAFTAHGWQAAGRTWGAVEQEAASHRAPHSSMDVLVIR